jgi:hypothetical protein
MSNAVLVIKGGSAGQGIGFVLSKRASISGNDIAPIAVGWRALSRAAAPKATIGAFTDAKLFNLRKGAGDTLYNP